MKPDPIGSMFVDDAEICLECGGPLQRRRTGRRRYFCRNACRQSWYRKQNRRPDQRRYRKSEDRVRICDINKATVAKGARKESKNGR